MTEKPSSPAAQSKLLQDVASDEKALVQFARDPQAYARGKGVVLGERVLDILKGGLLMAKYRVSGPSAAELASPGTVAAWPAEVSAVASVVSAAAAVASAVAG
jgi:hypothetical protein